MRWIAISRRATPCQMVAFALLFCLGATYAATHNRHDEALGAGGSADEPSHAAASIDLGELHSVAVHFPIAMLLSAALSEALLAATGRASFRHVTRFVIWIGALGAVTAAPLGWLAAATLEDAPERLLAWHRWLGVSTALWSIATLWASERSMGSRTGLRGMLAGAALLVAVTGYLGGELVHDPQAWSEDAR